MAVIMMRMEPMGKPNNKSHSICGNAFAPCNTHRRGCLLDGESVSCNLTPYMDTPELSTLPVQEEDEGERYAMPRPTCIRCNAITSANFTDTLTLPR